MSHRFGRALCLFGESHAALGLATIAAAIEPWPPSAAFATAAPDAGAAAAAAALAALDAAAANARDREPRRLADLAWQRLGGAVGAPDRALLLASALGGIHHLDFGPDRSSRRSPPGSARSSASRRRTKGAPRGGGRRTTSRGRSSRS